MTDPRVMFKNSNRAQPAYRAHGLLRLLPCLETGLAVHLYGPPIQQCHLVGPYAAAYAAYMVATPLDPFDKGIFYSLNAQIAIINSIGPSEHHKLSFVCI